MRNTNADWAAMAESEPYYAVLTAPQFLRANLTEDALAAFFASGVADVDWLLASIRHHVSPDFNPRTALDFGSGVGRLSLAMSAHCEMVTGVEIAPAMIAEATRNVNARAPGRNIRFVETIPDGPFDWVSSVLVIQHIPPARGMILLRSLLAALAPDGVVSLQFTAYRDPSHLNDAFAEAAALRFDGKRLEILQERPGPAIRMSMYDYDMTAVLGAYAGPASARCGLNTSITLAITHFG